MNRPDARETLSLSSGPPHDPHGSPAGGHNADPAALHAAGQALTDAAERMLRAPAGKLALALHLATLKPPAPRPHHLRIARALLQDTAQRYGGQVFTLGNSDLVLLCAAPAEEHPPAPGQAAALSGHTPPAALPAIFARLFSAEAADSTALTTVWRLDKDEAAFRAYLARRPAEAPLPPPAAASPAASAAGLAMLEAQLAAIPVTALLSHQTAIQLRPATDANGRPLPLAARVAPVFRELTLSVGALPEPHNAGEAISDPYLFRHVSARLDARMLEHLQADLESHGRLTRPALRQRLPLHLNLTLDSIASPAFGRLVQAARRAGLRFGIEISLMDAACDLPLMHYARSVLDMAGFPLVLDGLDHAALSLTQLAELRPDLAKITWSKSLAEVPAAQKTAIDAAIAKLTPARIVLARAEAEDALVWGQAHGITRYQGFFLDAVQAAGRIAICHSARACTLRQCMARAGTANPAIRAACGNPAQLDMAPTALQPPTPPATSGDHAAQRAR